MRFKILSSIKIYSGNTTVEHSRETHFCADYESRAKEIRKGVVENLEANCGGMSYAIESRLFRQLPDFTWEKADDDITIKSEP